MDDDHKQRLRARASKQVAHNQHSLYRACSPITTFRVRDPDPNAFDGGSVLGLRFESMRRGRFQAPHYVFLNRPWKPRSEALRVHRHTIPEWIPLGALAARYLPAPKLQDEQVEEGSPSAGADDMLRGGQKQDLRALAMHVRRELARRQLRAGAISDLRDAAGLRKRRRSSLLAQPEEGALSEITIVDAEAKHVRLEWADGRTGRLVVGDDGEVEQLVVFRENERDREAERELIRGTGHGVKLEDVVRWAASE